MGHLKRLKKIRRYILTLSNLQETLQDLNLKFSEISAKEKPILLKVSSKGNLFNCN